MSWLLPSVLVSIATAGAAFLLQSDDPPEPLPAFAFDALALDAYGEARAPARTLRAGPPTLRGRARGVPGSNAHRVAALIRRYVEPRYWKITPNAVCHASGTNTLVIEAHPPILAKVRRFLKAMRAWYESSGPERS